VDAVVNTFHKIDPTFVTKSTLESTHQNCLHHLERGCLSDHPEVTLYLELKQGSEETFRRLKSSRGSSQQEGFHYYVRRSTAAKTVSPILYDLFLTDMTHRWNVDRAVEVNHMPEFRCYDLSLLSSIHTLYTNHQQVFTTNPVEGFVPITRDERPIEMFGCSRVINSILLKDILDDLQ
jgi:hypothetical protein